MIKRYYNLSFILFIPGIIAQIAGYALSPQGRRPPGSMDFVALFLLLGGTALAIVGFGYYAKAKGRNVLWAVAGLIGLPGLLILAVLKEAILGTLNLARMRS